ncbi:MutS-related protein [Segeticoccus rhizosphaerae]|uniref:MutS-related protein n=1 Tax=Segeticoccus rhizosphaerae TaxID=1104777 RepID=UPI00192E6165|nr:hypothetical protein [Ornithinicoccus soli]
MTQHLTAAAVAGRPLGFSSILFPGGEDPDSPRPPEPDFFDDLNLDHVVEAVIAGRDDYDLAPLFHHPLGTVEEITYRHEVFRDLEHPDLFGWVRHWAEQWSSMGKALALAAKLRHRHQKAWWFLESVDRYCQTVQDAAAGIAELDPQSAGLIAFADHLAGYAGSAEFARLRQDTARVRKALSEVSYCLHIQANHIRVSPARDEPDYSTQVLATFERFKRNAAKDYRESFKNYAEMNHVEEWILDLVAKLHPDTFAALDEFSQQHRDFAEPTLLRFDREIQFYAAYLHYLEPLRAAGLSFCYPTVSTTSRAVHAVATFDLALAHHLAGRTTVVVNEFHLEGNERVFVVSGPNQGGKTTFARTFGQLHYLARLGCPVPGKAAHLFLYDSMFTHFEKREDLETLSGKLQDDLIRIKSILQWATADSIIILNEIFTSTTLDDATFLGRKVMDQVLALGTLGVCVTFVDELARLGSATVSMVSTVDPDNPATRTYKVVRKPADGLAYAAAIAAKHGLTHDEIRRRLTS